MNYTAEWVTAALNMLAAASLAGDPNAVADASHRIEQVLRRRPLYVGESRSSSVNRTYFDHPLGVDYEVIEDDKRVRILRVWLVT